MPQCSIIDPKQSLVSASTILILSAIIIACSEFELRAQHEELSFFVTTCGFAGIIAFLALDFVALRRLEVQSVAGDIQTESRLSRHVAASIYPSYDIIKERAQMLEWLKRETRDLT